MALEGDGAGVVIEPFSGKRYKENSAISPAGTNPCAICGKPIKPDASTRWVWVVEGGSEFARPGEVHDEAGDMGMWPLGSDCYRRNRKDLEGYVVKIGIDIATDCDG